MGAAVTNAIRNANRNASRSGKGIGKDGKGAEVFGVAEAVHGFARPSFSFEDFKIPDILPDVKAEATILSPWPEDTDLAEAHLGAKWLGLGLLPQGIEIASVMQAREDSGRPAYKHVVVEMARRSTKTTAVLAALLGRCLTRDGYKVASTAQTGTKARHKLLEVIEAIRAQGFETDGLGTCLQGMGDTRIKFANGSTWQALPPKGSAFRSDAFDAVLVDESGEIDDETAADLLSGLIPTADTRPDSQIITAGTPGETRAGLLWDRLGQLRGSRSRMGGVVYEAPDGATFIDNETGAVNWGLLLRVHPGIGTLTDVGTIVGNIADLGLDLWSREYLCLWPRNAGVRALDVAAWEACAASGPAVAPANAALAFDVDPDGRYAALVAVWRDADGRACLEVIEAGQGTEWLPAAAQAAQSMHKGAISYDAIGQNLEVVNTMTAAPWRLRLAPIAYRDQVGAAARIEKAIAARGVVQFGDPALTDAVEGASWRPAGKDGRLFGRTASAASVAALVASAEALWAYDARAGLNTGRRRIITAASIEERRRLRQSA